MEREKAGRRQQAEREAAAKAAEAQRASRKDDPWVEEGLVVKVITRALRRVRMCVESAPFKGDRDPSCTLGAAHAKVQCCTVKCNMLPANQSPC